MSRSLESFKAFMSAPGRGPAYAPIPGVIAVGAGKGGVGTSLVSALLALEAARMGERTLLIDADENVGSLHMMLGLDDPGPGVGALRGGTIEPEDLLVPIAPRLTLLPGGGAGVEGTLSGASAEFRALMRRISGLFGRYSTVVIDGGSRLESMMAVCAAGADRLLCVTEPDRISLASTYALFKVARARFEALPIELIVNGTDEHAGRTVHATVRAATQAFLGTDVQFAGTVPTDPILRRRMEAAISVAHVDPEGAAVSAVGSVMSRIIAERHGPEGEKALFSLLPGA